MAWLRNTSVVFASLADAESAKTGVITIPIWSGGQRCATPKSGVSGQQLLRQFGGVQYPAHRSQVVRPVGVQNRLIAFEGVPGVGVSVAG